MLKQLISSNLRVRVLEHFFFHPGEEFYVRQLASALDEPPATVGRELSHLEDVGILASRPIGNQRHYRLNENCPILDDLRNIFLKTSGASAELANSLRKFSGVDIAFIYGSYASGEATPASDLDVMIVGKVPDRELAPAVARVERKLGREINYTVYSREELKKRLGKAGDFVHEVFAGPRIMLVGTEDDELLEVAR